LCWKVQIWKKESRIDVFFITTHTCRGCLVLDTIVQDNEEEYQIKIYLLHLSFLMVACTKIPYFNSFIPRSWNNLELIRRNRYRPYGISMSISCILTLSSPNIPDIASFFYPILTICEPPQVNAIQFISLVCLVECV